MIEESVVDPNAKIATGYPPNVMPRTFGRNAQSEEEVEQLVEYLIETRRKAASGPKGKAGRLSAPSGPLPSSLVRRCGTP